MNSKCTKCNAEFNTKSKLEEHSKRMHQSRVKVQYIDGFIKLIQERSKLLILFQARLSVLNAGAHSSIPSIFKGILKPFVHPYQKMFKKTMWSKKLSFLNLGLAIATIVSMVYTCTRL
jgi:hypothetical protein